MNKTLLIVISVFLGLAVVTGVILLIVEYHRTNSSPKGGGSRSTNGTLYLLPEALSGGGFNVKDIILTTKTNNLIDPIVARNLFPQGLAVIANNSGTNAAGLQAQWNNPRITKLAKDSGLAIHKWISFYFGKDGNWCRCQNGAWTDTKHHPERVGKIECTAKKGVPCDSCTDKDINKWVPWDSKTCSVCKTPNNNLCLTGGNSVVDKILAICTGVPDLEGIMFDDEVGDPTYIIEAMEAVKTQWDKTTGKNLLLGWTGGVSAANNPRPRNLPGKYVWDVCLGQAYTNTTGTYYKESCTPADDWWQKVAGALGNSPHDRGVPMVCGAGNCIGDKGQANNICIDERLSGDVISTLLKSRPPNFPWKSFGIWYGKYDVNTGFFGCTNNNCPTEHGCCKTWKTK